MTHSITPAAPSPDQALVPAVQASACTPPLDEDTYRQHLAPLALTREEEDALLQALWSMMRCFVDLGFGVDAIQASLEGRGMPDGGPTSKSTLLESGDALQLQETGTASNAFRKATTKHTNKKEKVR